MYQNIYNKHIFQLQHKKKYIYMKNKLSKFLIKSNITSKRKNKPKVFLVVAYPLLNLKSFTCIYLKNKRIEEKNYV